MSGVLQVLKDNGFKCYAPRVTDNPIDIDEAEDSRPVYRPFETPAPDREQIEVTDSPTGAPSLFRYFLDGSMRTTSAGHVVDTKQRFLPLFIAQVGVAATKLNHFQIGVESYTNKNILFLPETFSDGDIRKARHLVRKALRHHLPLDTQCRILELRRSRIVAINVRRCGSTLIPILCRHQRDGARGMTEIALFAHPLPEVLNRIEVRAIAWQGYDREAQLQSRRLHTLGLVPRGAVPDEHDLTRFITYPGGNVV